MAQFDRGGFSGTWLAEFVDDFGQRRTCRLELSGASSIFGGNRANAISCPGPLMSVSLWQLNGRGLTLNDMAGRTIANLRRSRGGYSGRTNAGQAIWLRGTQSNTPFDPVIVAPARPRGCAIYYGSSDRCAEARDVAAPRLAYGQTATVRIVYSANLRQSPSLNAPSLGLVPVNVCTVVDSCGVQPDGAEWCRMRYGDRTGYMVKTFTRDGRRSILYSNGCRPG